MIAFVKSMTPTEILWKTDKILALADMTLRVKVVSGKTISVEHIPQANMNSSNILL